MLISQANSEAIKAVRALHGDIQQMRFFAVTMIVIQAMGLLGAALIIFG